MRKSTRSPEHLLLRSLLNEIRTQAGLSQRALALKLKVPHTWVAKVESGERRLDLIEFGWFCSACDRDPTQVASLLFTAIRERETIALPPRRSTPKRRLTRAGGRS
jgi:transcriptional regulator with XRE-family HTH domain